MPETAPTIVPFVSLNGVDVFETNCRADGDVDIYASEHFPRLPATQIPGKRGTRPDEAR